MQQLLSKTKCVYLSKSLTIIKERKRKLRFEKIWLLWRIWKDKKKLHVKFFFFSNIFTFFYRNHFLHCFFLSRYFLEILQLFSSFSTILFICSVHVFFSLSLLLFLFSSASFFFLTFFVLIFHLILIQLFIHNFSKHWLLFSFALMSTLLQRSNLAAFMVVFY